MIEHYFIIKWSADEGWQIDEDKESKLFPNGTIWNDELKRWQYGYLGDGEYTEGEQEVSEFLTGALEILNKATLKTGEE